MSWNITEETLEKHGSFFAHCFKESHIVLKPEMESRTQLRLEANAKTKDTKKSEAKDSPSKNRPARGQGEEYSRPRTGILEAKAKDTGASVLQKKKKGFKKFFRCSPKKKGFEKFFSGDLQKFFSGDLQKFFQAICKILTIQEILLFNLEPRAGQFSRT